VVWYLDHWPILPIAVMITRWRRLCSAAARRSPWENALTVYKPVRALERGLAVLQAVNVRDGLKTHEIASVVGLSRPTVFRLLETLQARGFVLQSHSSGTWHPTLECNLLSSGYRDKAWVGQIAMPEMIALTQNILWPVDLVTYDGDAMLVRESTHKISPFSFDYGIVGQRMPILQTSGGHSWLAFCPDPEREVIFEILRDSERPEDTLIHDSFMIAQILERSRRAGYGIRSEGFRDHTHSISAPIYKDDALRATLTVICLKSAVSFKELTSTLATKLLSVTQLIGDRLTVSET
jgi:IclR family mhp operon transcriptional activator